MSSLLSPLLTSLPKTLLALSLLPTSCLLVSCGNNSDLSAIDSPAGNSTLDNNTPSLGIQTGNTSSQGSEITSTDTSPTETTPAVTPIYRETTFLETPAVTEQSDYHDTQLPTYPWQTRADAMVNGYELELSTPRNNFSKPWGLDFLPDGRLLVSEMRGRIHVLNANNYSTEYVIDISGKKLLHDGSRAGLMDVHASINFANDNYVYFTYSGKKDDSAGTALGRIKLADGASSFKRLYLEDSDITSTNHMGSRIAQDKAGHLYISIGDYHSPDEAQNIENTIGSIIRLKSNGGIPLDNPFVGTSEHQPETWSFGHRNPQGMAIHPETEELWNTEHGPIEGDELNRPKAGKNYGWPIISYGYNNDTQSDNPLLSELAGLEQPTYYWSPSIAPSNLIFYSGALFSDWKNDILLCAMTKGAIIRLRLDGDKVIGEEWLINGDERIRDIAEAPNGDIVWITDNGNLKRLTTQ